MRFEMVAIEPEEFAMMRARLPLATAAGLMDTYRISQNTWYKLRDGVPVKRKTLEQVRERYRMIAGEPERCLIRSGWRTSESLGFSPISPSPAASG